MSDKGLPIALILTTRYSVTDFDVVEELRNSSSSPITHILADPAVTQKILKGKGKDRKHYSVLSALIVVLNEEVIHLKSLLRNAESRLEHETRRADDAAARAEYAQRRQNEAFIKAASAEAALRAAELENARSGEEIQRQRLQLTELQRELSRVRDELSSVETSQKSAEEDAENAIKAARESHLTLQAYQAHDRERDREQLLLARKYLEEGREQGYEEGRMEGFEQGLKKGKKEGFHRGREAGRNEEHKNALEAFDRFLAEDEEHEGKSTTAFSRTRRWANSVYAATRGLVR